MIIMSILSTRKTLEGRIQVTVTHHVPKYLKVLDSTLLAKTMT